MDFDSFSQALVKVADYLFLGMVENSGQALKGLLDHHLLPMASKLDSTLTADLAT